MHYPPFLRISSISKYGQKLLIDYPLQHMWLTMCLAQNLKEPLQEYSQCLVKITKMILFSVFPQK